MTIKQRKTEFTIFGYKIFIVWLRRFTYHPTNHGPNCTPKIVKRPELTIVRCFHFEPGKAKDWNLWFYLPSRTYTASFGFGPADDRSAKPRHSYAAAHRLMQMRVRSFGRLLLAEAKWLLRL